MKRWAFVGKLTALVLVWLFAVAILGIVELYWAGVYEFVVDWTVSCGLVWLIFLRKAVAS